MPLTNCSMFVQLLHPHDRICAAACPQWDRCSLAWFLIIFVIFVIYAGRRISAQLLCRNVTPICIIKSAPVHIIQLCADSGASIAHLCLSTSTVLKAGYLTANNPTAVTTLLFSLSVNARSVLCAKLGSAMVRPLPWTCLGGILVVRG
jgi:hypothetical protein